MIPTILATMILESAEIDLQDYLECRIDAISYQITHDMAGSEHNKIYLEGKMDAYEDILNLFDPI